MLAILGVLLATTIAGGGFVVYEQRSADDLVRIAGLIVTFTAILLVVLGLVLVRFEQLRSTHDENTVGCEGGTLRRVAHERKRGPR